MLARDEGHKRALYAFGSSIANIANRNDAFKVVDEMIEVSLSCTVKNEDRDHNLVKFITEMSDMYQEVYNLSVVKDQQSTDEATATLFRFILCRSLCDVTAAAVACAVLGGRIELGEDDFHDICERIGTHGTSQFQMAYEMLQGEVAV